MAADDPDHFASPAVVAWVAAAIVPHEAGARRWLARRGVAPVDRDDLLQEAYCRLAALPDVAHISNPKAYLLQTVRNIWLAQLRRQRVVPMTTATENLAATIMDDAAGPDQLAEDREELALVQALVAGLPERCRQIFLWKRIEGLSQKEIAARLGVSETVVENDVMKGLRLILAGMAEGQALSERQRA